MAQFILQQFRKVWNRGRMPYCDSRGSMIFPPWEISAELRGLLDIVRPFTLSDSLRLSVLYGLAHETVHEVPGDLVECGVCNGGSAAVLAASALETSGRNLWLYDTFSGLPVPGSQDGPEACKYAGELVGSPEVVAQVLDRVGFPRERAIFRQGTFQETYRLSLPERVALLHIDADWYAGVVESLRTFYPRVPPGGVIVLDDFGHWEGARRAFYDFCLEQAIAPLLERVGYTQAFWRKGQEHTRAAQDRYNCGCYRPRRQ